jgi:hypothetical protein
LPHQLSRRTVVSAVAAFAGLPTVVTAVAAITSSPSVITSSALSDAIAAAGARLDYRAMFARVEQMIELLRIRYMCAGWNFDEEAAARTLKYFQRMAANPRLDDDDDDDYRKWETVRAFISDHGQSFDWIIYGNGARTPHAASRAS